MSDLAMFNDSYSWPLVMGIIILSLVFLCVLTVLCPAICCAKNVLNEESEDDYMDKQTLVALPPPFTSSSSSK